MYQKRSSGFGLFRIILLGIVMGGVFFAYDTWRNSQSDSAPAQPQLAVNDDQAPGQTAANQPDNNTGSNTSQTSQNALYVSNVSESAEIFIPSVGITAPITQAYLDGTSWDVSHLGTSVGHLQGTSWVSDAPGNIVLSGHVELSDGRRGVFAELEDMQVGERIVINENGQERVYMVVAVSEVEPSDLTPLYPTEFERLTLITCGGYDFFADEYEIRTVVIADRIS